MSTVCAIIVVLVLDYAKLLRGDFVETQHARVETRWGLNEPNCGLVRLPLQSPKGCFRSRFNQTTIHPNYRIARGQTAADGEFPWMVSLIWRLWTGVFRYSFCGGAIVNKRWILTAAHCIESKFTSIVRIQVGSNTMTGGNVWYEVERFEVYKGYYDSTNNDIGLIKTKTEIEYVVDEERNMYVVNSICLPQEHVINTDDEFAQLAGFGYLGRDKTNPEFLQKVGGVIENVQLHLHQLKEVIDLDLQHAMACQGDSGSSLFQYDGRKAVVIGVVSGGFPTTPEEWDLFHKGSLICSIRNDVIRVSYFISNFIKDLLLKNAP